MEREYKIWMEGFNIMEGHSGASLLGRAVGKSFKEACDKHFKDDPLYNPEHMTYWGCQLFETEQAARISFG